MPGSEVSAVHRALSNLFTTLTPEQLRSFVEEMNRPALGAIETIPAATAPPALSSAQSPILPAPDVNMTFATVTKRDTMTRSPSRKRSRENGKLRPLNSFMAFRSFYSASFPDLSQKVKSGLLRLLWRSDPLKAKWAILAKAYSIIRDKHVGQVTLESFLALNGPFIGIISPGSYIQTMGLQLVADENKQFSLVRMNNPTFSQADLTTNLSADDIVRHCYHAGYVTGELPEEDPSLQNIGVAMAVSAQPSYQHTIAPAATRPEIGAPPTMTANTTLSPSSQAEDIVEMGNQISEDSQLVNTQLATGVEQTNGPIIANTTIAISNVSNNGNIHPRTNVPYTAAEFETDLRRAFSSYTPDDYYGLFQPLRQPAAVYNPYLIQGEFDPFDVDDYVNM